MRLETVGKQMERNWKGLENLQGVDGNCKGTAVMRGRAGNARLMGQMMYDRCFSF